MKSEMASLPKLFQKIKNPGLSYHIPFTFPAIIAFLKQEHRQQTRLKYNRDLVITEFDFSTLPRALYVQAILLIHDFDYY